MDTVPITHGDAVGSASNAAHWLTHQALLDRVRDGDYDASPQYLRAYVSRLRAKLRHGGGTEYIETEPVSTLVGGLRT